MFDSSEAVSYFLGYFSDVFLSLQSTDCCKVYPFKIMYCTRGLQYFQKNSSSAQAFLEVC